MAVELLMPDGVDPTTIRCVCEQRSDFSSRSSGNSQESMKLVVSVPVKSFRDVGLDRKRGTSKLPHEVLISTPAVLESFLDDYREGPGFLPAAQIFVTAYAGHAEGYVLARSESSSRLSNTGTGRREVAESAESAWEQRCTMHSAPHPAPGTRHPAP